jgi:hypothetical protein
MVERALRCPPWMLLHLRHREPPNRNCSVETQLDALRNVCLEHVCWDSDGHLDQLPACVRREAVGSQYLLRVGLGLACALPGPLLLLLACRLGCDFLRRAFRLRLGCPCFGLCTLPPTPTASITAAAAATT